MWCIYLFGIVLHSLAKLEDPSSNNEVNTKDMCKSGRYEIATSKCYSSCLAVAMARSIAARDEVENQDVILLPIKVKLVLEVWR